MKKKKVKIKVIRNMRELAMLKQQLSFQEKLYEKELAGSAANVVDNFAGKARDMAFELGSRLMVELFRLRYKHKNAGSGEE